MNPFGLLLIGLGIILFIIGFKGSQHEVINAFKGIKGGPASQQAATPISPTSDTGTQVQTI